VNGLVTGCFIARVCYVGYTGPNRFGPINRDWHLKRSISKNSFYFFRGRPLKRSAFVNQFLEVVIFLWSP
jgi:hypothetical protein